MKQELISTERAMLSKLGFHVAIDHPHKFILSYLRVLGSENDRYVALDRTRPHASHTHLIARVRTRREFAQKAWNFLNDSLRTTVCLRFSAEVVATAAIYMAARLLRLPLPESPPWWELFEVSFERTPSSLFSSLFSLS